MAAYCSMFNKSTLECVIKIDIIGKVFDYPIDMKNLAILTILFLGISTGSIAQKDFSKLSGRAKAKLAKKERKEAKKDKEYQLMMEEAHDNFVGQKYHDALDLYEKARERRPLNVYPKVKIEDVLLAMQNQPQEENVETVFEDPLKIESPPEPEKISDPADAQERIEEVFEEEIQKAEDIVEKEVPPPPKEEKSEPKVDKVVIVKDEDLKPMSEAQLREDLGQRYEDGVHEKTFTEGNKTITERIVVKEGLGDIYRRVQYAWGAFYFKNNKSVTKNTWDQSYK